MTEVKSMAWNVEKGGFSTYDNSEAEPPKQDIIRSVIRDIQPDALTLSDVFRWNSYYNGDAGIAQFLGMEWASFTPLQDERLIQTHPSGADLGVVFATTQPVALSETLDLETRQANKTILDIGKYGLQYASLYLDDLREDVRERQLRAALAQLEKHVPTIIQGDLNMQRLLEMARSSEKVRSAMVRLVIRMLPAQSDKIPVLQELEKRQAMKVLVDANFQDGDPKQRPTALGKARLFGVDYIMSRGEGATVSNFKTLPHQGGSDHLAVYAEVNVN
jgi:endonuclease/exonuclease/phosphatase family metal-dependent hydrolase